MNMYKFSDEPTGTHALLINQVKPNSKVLDVGCAGGYLGENLVSEKKCEVWGIEPDTKNYDEALKKGYKIIFNKKFEEAAIDIKNEKFDFILIGDVLEHLEQPEKVMELLPGLLNDDGRLIVSLPNVAHYSVRFGLLFGHWDMVETGILDRTHLHFFTLKSAEDMLRNGKWDIELMRPRGDLERWFRKIGLEWIGKKILFLWPQLFAIQFIFVAGKKKYE